MKKTIKKNETSTSSEIIIGSQVWMVQNLNVSTFRNGDDIPQAKTDDEWERAGEKKQPAWCYYDNDPANGEKYGKLFNWYAVNDPRGLAPTGYHVPSDLEWEQLSDYLGSVAGKTMKSTSGWINPAGNSKGGNGTNKSGFNGIPGGYRDDEGVFWSIGGYGLWCSSTENTDLCRGEAGTNHAWFRALDCLNSKMTRVCHTKYVGFSVRCLKD